MCNILDIAIAQAWVHLLLSIFHQIFFNNATLSNSGFLPFILLILLFINSYIDIKIEKIKFTKLYLGCFKNPEQAIRYWLNFRFYFGLLSGFLIVGFSIKSFFSLCTIDFVSLFTNISAADPEVYIGKFLAEAKLESIKKMSLALLFVTFTYLLIFVLNKKKVENKIERIVSKNKHGATLSKRLADPLQIFFLSSCSKKLQLMLFANGDLLEVLLSAVSR